MANSNGESVRYPLLQALLEQKGFLLQGIYKVRDGAKIFDVGRRTIQEWVRDGTTARDLPGQGRFLPEDFAQLLANRIKRGDATENSVRPEAPTDARQGTKESPHFGDRYQARKHSFPGGCVNCGALLKGKWRGALYCDEICKKLSRGRQLAGQDRIIRDTELMK
jgi:hypothetical protein